MKKRIPAALIAVIMILTLIMPSALAESEDKKEMVYVVTDAYGAATEIVVSERLYNHDGADELTDVSTLDNIEVIEGDQTYTSDGDTLIWDADGSDIRYEGTSDKDLPVGVKLTYKLDGEEIAADDLAGKSGHLEIDIEYQANEMREVTVNGETEEMPVPFLMATVMLCKDDVFENIEVTNGKVIDIGDRKLILCVGLPGVSDALKLDTYEDLDVEIPTSATITADVTDFASDGTYTVATNSLFNDIDIDVDDYTLDIDIDDIKKQFEDARDKLLDGVKQLADGAGELYDGLTEIDENSDTLVDAARQVLETVMETANEQLSESQEDFDKLGITLNELTVDNYDTEITRLQTELLDKVEDYVLEQADATLESKVNSAVEEEVESQVKAAAEKKVEAAVKEAVKPQVRAQVEAAAREKVESAVRNPDEATLNAEIESQMQTDSVKSEIESNVKQQLASDSVQSALKQQLESTVRAKVEAAYKENIRSQIESGYSATIRDQVTAAYREQIRQQIIAAVTPTEAPTAAPTEAPTEASDETPTEAPDDEVSESNSSDGTDIDAMVEAKLNSDEIQSAIDAAVSDKIDSLTEEKLASDEIKAAIESEITKQMSDPDVLAQAQAQAEATVREKVEEAAREKVRTAILNMSDEQVSAIVDQQMASDSIKSQIDAETAKQMKSDNVKSIIQKNIKEQMESDSVKQQIKDNVKQQLASKKVKNIISETISENRQSKEYIDSVAEALEENGENGAAYQALVKLHDTLDDMCDFYEGVVEYTDAVGKCKDGAQELSDGVDTLNTTVTNLLNGDFDELDSDITITDDMKDDIEKLLDYLDGGLTEIKDRVDALLDITRDYNSYAGIAEGKSGTVQFLIRTAGI